MAFEPKCLNTAIGSVPFADAEEALDLIWGNFPELPFWPQLSRRSFHENMYVQFTEGLPAVAIDEDAERVWFDTTGDVVAAVELFYESYISERTDDFAISSDYAAGLHRYLARAAAEPPAGMLLAKGHVTGPVSLGLAVTDSDKRPALYHDLLRDPLVKGLAMKVKWQEQKLAEVAPDGRTLIFIDEPYLTSFGSAFVSVSRPDVLGWLGEVIGAAQGLTGVHCCGKTDWTLFTEAGTNVISFDAYDYAESIALYPKELGRWLEDGGMLAWGVVPSVFPAPDQIAKEEVDSLVGRFEEGIGLLADRGLDRDLLVRRALITPSCGTGSMEPALATRTLTMTRRVSERLRDKYRLA